MILMMEAVGCSRPFPRGRRAKLVQSGQWRLLGWIEKLHQRCWFRAEVLAIELFHPHWPMHSVSIRTVPMLQEGVETSAAFILGGDASANALLKDVTSRPRLVLEA